MANGAIAPKRTFGQGTFGSGSLGSGGTPALYLGTKPVLRVYVGTRVVWPVPDPTPDPPPEG